MCYCPQVVSDLEKHIMFAGKYGTTFCIGSRTVDKYFFLNDSQVDTVMYAIQHMDGNNTIEGIHDIIKDNLQKEVNVEQLCRILSKSNLLTAPFDGTDQVKEFDELRSLLVPIKSFTLNKLFGIFAKIPFPNLIIVILLMLSAALSITLFITAPKLSTISFSGIFSNQKALLFYVFVSVISIMLHEFSHAMVGTHFGLKPSTLTLAAYAYVSPMIYIKLPGLYFIPPKKRIMTWIAGVIVNISIFVIAYPLSMSTLGDVSLFWLVVAYCNLTITIFSLNPLYYSDGYYIISTVLKKPNLRKSSLKSFGRIIRGQIKLEDIIYAGYFLLVFFLLSYFMLPQLINTVTNIIEMARDGAPMLEIIGSFSNILIVAVLGVIGKIYSSRVKKREIK